MAKFKYVGRDNKGNSVSGELVAETKASVASMLLQQSITPIKIQSTFENAGLQQLMNLQLGKPKVKPVDLMMFCRQMYTLLRAGVPIIKSVTRLAETTRSKALATTLFQVVEAVSSGQTLTAALRNHPAVFTKIFVSIVGAGEASGQLDEAFVELSKHLELEEKTRARIKSAMRYPILVIVAMVAAITVMNFMVIPAFVKMFEKFKTELPLPTRIMMATSNFMVHNWMYIVASIIVVVMGIRFAMKVPAIKMAWERAKLQIPIFGPIMQRIILSRFSRTFTMIIKTGVPLVEGIGLVAHAMGNEFITQRILLMQADIGSGETLTRAATKTKLFSPLVLQMLDVGEEAGQLDTILQEVAEFYEREVDYDLSRLSDMIEPFLLIFLGALILLLALGVFLPMWDMASFAKK